MTFQYTGLVHIGYSPTRESMAECDYSSEFPLDSHNPVVSGDRVWFTSRGSTLELKVDHVRHYFNASGELTKPQVQFELLVFNFECDYDKTCDFFENFFQGYR